VRGAATEISVCLIGLLGSILPCHPSIHPSIHPSHSIQLVSRSVIGACTTSAMDQMSKSWDSRDGQMGWCKLLGLRLSIIGNRDLTPRSATATWLGGARRTDRRPNSQPPARPCLLLDLDTCVGVGVGAWPQPTTTGAEWILLLFLLKRKRELQKDHWMEIRIRSVRLRFSNPTKRFTCPRIIQRNSFLGWKSTHGAASTTYYTTT